MRILTSIVQLALTTLVLSCDQRHSASDVDPKLGRECFESHRASLPPGTQYEGIEKLAENGFTIKIMNGVELVALECGLNPDGTLSSTGKWLPFDVPMQKYPEIKRFVQEILGCSCPEEVFNKIDYQEEREGISGRKINVGDRLLIYIITTDRESNIQRVINSALEQGVAERDKEGFNRFRLVLVDARPDELRSTAEHAFHSSGGTDEKTHLHIVSESDVEDLWSISTYHWIWKDEDHRDRFSVTKWTEYDCISGWRVARWVSTHYKE